MTPKTKAQAFIDELEKAAKNNPEVDDLQWQIKASPATILALINDRKCLIEALEKIRERSGNFVAIAIRPSIQHPSWLAKDALTESYARIAEMGEK